MKCAEQVSQANMVTVHPCVVEVGPDRQHEGPCYNPSVPTSDRARKRWERAKDDPEIQEARRVLGGFQQTETAEDWTTPGTLGPHPQQRAARLSVLHEEDVSTEELAAKIEEGMKQPLQVLPGPSATDLVTGDVAEKIEAILQPLREGLINYVMDQLLYPQQTVEAPVTTDDEATRLRGVIQAYRDKEISYADLVKAIE